MLNIMKRARASVFLLGLCFGSSLGFLSGCAAGTPVATNDAADTKPQLKHAVAEHELLQTKLGSAPPARRSSCELSAGDCLIQVAESRGRLVSTFRLDPCEQAEADAKSSCVTAQLSHQGHEQALVDYYKLENWCFKKVADCTDAKAEEARVAALDERFSTRRAELASSKEGSAARQAVDLTRARIEYLRSTLPPKAAEICAPQADFEACQAQAEAGQKALDEQLRPDEYDAKQATATYAALRQSEASCHAPELSCLSKAVAEYGVFPESRKYVDRNLALLARRAELGATVSEQQRTSCLSSSQRAHQATIVGAYVSYAKDPVLYFRTALDKAFIELHEAQVGCLTAKNKAQSGALPVAGQPAAKTPPG